MSSATGVLQPALGSIPQDCLDIAFEFAADSVQRTCELRLVSAAWDRAAHNTIRFIHGSTVYSSPGPELARLRLAEQFSSSTPKAIQRLIALVRQQELAACSHTLAHGTARVPLKFPALRTVVYDSAGLAGPRVSHKARWEALVEPLRTMPLLTAMSLRGCEWITDRLVAGIVAASPALESVDLSGCVKVTEGGFGALSQLKLRNIVLENCAWNITDEVLSILAGGSTGATVERLSLSHSGSFTGDGVRALGRGCPELRCLSLHRCRSLQHSSVLDALASVSQLEELDIGSIPAQPVYNTQQNLPNRHNHLVRVLPRGFAAAFPSAVALRMSGFTDDDIAAAECPRLRELRVCISPHCTPGNLFRRLRFLSATLRHLDLSGSWITAEHVAAIAQALPTLQTLKLSCTEGLVSLSGIEALQQLEHLDISSCPMLGEDGMRSVFALAPSLRCLVVGNQPVTEATVRSIGTLSNLRRLVMSGVNCDADCITTALKSLPLLEDVRLPSNANTVKQALDAVADAGLKRLRSAEFEPASTPAHHQTQTLSERSADRGSTASRDLRIRTPCLHTVKFAGVPCGSPLSCMTDSATSVDAVASW